MLKAAFNMEGIGTSRGEESFNTKTLWHKDNSKGAAGGLPAGKRKRLNRREHGESTEERTKPFNREGREERQEEDQHQATRAQRASEGREAGPPFAKASSFAEATADKPADRSGKI